MKDNELLRTGLIETPLDPETAAALDAIVAKVGIDAVRQHVRKIRKPAGRKPEIMRYKNFLVFCLIETSRGIGETIGGTCQRMERLYARHDLILKAATLRRIYYRTQSEVQDFIRQLARKHGINYEGEFHWAPSSTCSLGGSGATFSRLTMLLMHLSVAETQLRSAETECQKVASLRQSIASVRQNIDEYIHEMLDDAFRALSENTKVISAQLPR